VIKSESLSASIAQMHHVFAPMAKELDSDFRLLMQLCVPMLVKLALNPKLEKVLYLHSFSR
jgi:hypothetical protein